MEPDAARGGPSTRRRRSRPRRSATATGIVAAWVLLAGCGLIGDDASTPAQVVVLGDSITYASAEALSERFSDRPAELTIDARPGSTAEEVRRRAHTVMDDLGDTGPEQVIVNVGTNDVMLGYDPSRTLDDVTAMVDLFADARCVHVVTISRQILVLDDPGLGDRIEELNGLLGDLADERSAVRILDWNLVLDDPPADLETGDLLAGDTVHTSPLGEAILADAYVAALDGCD